MKKLSLILLITCVFSFVSILSPGLSLAANKTNPVLESKKVKLNGGDFDLSLLESSDKKAKFKLKNNKIEDVIEVDYETMDFTVTSKKGEKKTYNAKDFISDQEPEIIEYNEEDIIGETKEEENLTPPEEIVPIETLLPKETNNNEPVFSALATPNGTYITDLNAKLNVSGTISWTHAATYKSNPLDVYAYTANHWEYTTAAKKFQFDAWTALSIITGAIAAFVGAAFGIAGLIAVLEGLNVTVANEVIKYAFTPTIRVKRNSSLRAFYVYGKGFSLATKKWSDYVEAAQDGKIVLNKYQSDSYNAWYNDRETWQVADVAYQEHRWIAGERSTHPGPSEFYWN